MQNISIENIFIINTFATRSEGQFLRQVNSSMSLNIIMVFEEK